MRQEASTLLEVLNIGTYREHVIDSLASESSAGVHALSYASLPMDLEEAASHVTKKRVSFFFVW